MRRGISVAEICCRLGKMIAMVPDWPHRLRTAQSYGWSSQWGWLDPEGRNPRMAAYHGRTRRNSPEGFDNGEDGMAVAVAVCMDAGWVCVRGMRVQCAVPSWQSAHRAES